MIEPALSILQSRLIIEGMDDRIGLGPYIRARRESLGMTARALAASADIEPPLLSRIETGVMKTLPEPAVLRRIAKALNTTVSALTTAAGYFDDPSPGERVIPPTLIELHALLDSVNWTAERTGTIRLILKQYQELDRKQ
jgi:transcriptional regulator with XRE-family HTH domain